MRKQNNFNYFKSAILTKQNSPLTIDDIKISEIPSNYLLIKIKYTYICGTQLNEWLGKKGPDKFIPHTLGHEACGEVIGLGKKIKSLRIKDKVVISWIPKIKKITVKKNCYYNKKGEAINTGPVSTFMEFALIPEDRVYKISKNIYDEHSALFGCAFPTGVGVALKAMTLSKKNDFIILYGIGGVGMIALTTLLYFGYQKIIIVEKDKIKINFAKKIGKKRVLIPKNFEKFLKKNNFFMKIKLSIECSGNIKLMNNAVNLISTSGICIIAGNTEKGQKINLDPYDIIFGKKIIGSIGGDINIEKNLSLFSKILKKFPLLKNFFSKKKYKLKDINLAINDFKNGKVLRPLIEVDKI